MTEIATAQRVCVVTAPGFEALGQGIALYLGDRGLRSRVGAPTADDDAVVVVLARELPDGVPNLLDLPGRLVPVTVGGVAGEQVPGRLAELNWIPWTPERKDAALAAIHDACVTELDSFFEAQSLEARAAGWEVAGRSDADLVRTKRELRQLTGGLGEHVALSPRARDFVDRSRRATRASTIKAWAQRILWTGLAVAVALGVWQSVTTVQRYQERRSLYLLASDVEGTAGATTVQIQKLAGLVLLSDEIGEPVPLGAEEQLATFLSTPGPVQYFAVAPNDMFLNDMAIDSSGNLLVASGDGTLWRGRIGDALLTPDTSLPHQSFRFAADDTLSRWAASDGAQITVGGAGQPVTLSSGLAAGVAGLRMQGDGSTLVAEGDGDGSVEVYDLGAAPALVRSSSDVVGVSEAGGKLVLLTVDDGAVRSVDARTGDRLGEVSAPGDVTMATVLSDGRIVFVSGGRLWAQDGTTARNVGAAVPGVIEIQATGSDEVMVVTVGEGVRLFNVADGAPVAQVCRESSAVRRALTGGSRWMVCNYGASTWVWDLNTVRPTARGGDGASSAEETRGDTTARIANGALEISRSGRTVRLDPAGVDADRAGELEVGLLVSGSLTTVALLPDGSSLAYGTDQGEVVVADLSEGLEPLLSQEWTDLTGLPVTSLALSPDRLDIVTSAASWSVPSCAGCRTDRGRLMAAVAARRLPCYGSSFDRVMPARISAQLDLRVCGEEA